MDGSDRTATRSGRRRPSGDGEPDRGARPGREAPLRHVRSHGAIDSSPEPVSATDWSSDALATDGGQERDRPLAERSRESIEAEIEELEQSPERYETRDQAVIDRYEGLLAEQRRRQQAAEDDRSEQSRRQLERVKDRFLRTLGLR